MIAVTLIGHDDLGDLPEDEFIPLKYLIKNNRGQNEGTANKIMGI